MIPPLTKRIDLNLGYSCNIKCRFCYYINDVRARNRDKDLSTRECKRLIRYYRRRKMEVLEFTGGEPTIRPDLFELAAFAKEAGFTKVSVITNGIRLAEPDYARRLAASGVSDYLLSLHGSSTDTHDLVTCVPGSYERLLQAIRNLLALKVKVRCNSVITGATLHDIHSRAKLFAQLGVKTVNFIMFNPIEQASGCGEENFFRYSAAAGYLKQAIDDFGSNFHKLTIRYMPFCFMPGYEKYIQNVHQVHYDQDEWDYYLRAYIREPYWKWLGGVLFGLCLLPAKAQWRELGLDQARHAGILEAHSWLHKRKFPQCRACRYGFICGGVWKAYAARFGAGELKPQPGKLIAMPWHFMTAEQRGL